MTYFSYNGAKIHYVDIDKSPNKSGGVPLVFVHGAGSYHFSWALQLLEFSQTNRCIAIDLDGHGKSDLITGDTSIPHGYTKEVAALIDHLELQDFIIIGHSMGGGVVMSYVLNSEFRSPKALVLVDTSPILNLPRVVPGLLVEVVEESRRRDHPAFDEYAEKVNMKQHEYSMKYVDPIAMQRDLLACNKFDITDRIKDIAIPTFALVGENDNVITPAIVKEYIEHIPHADLAVVRGADHTPMIEQPEEFNRLLCKFITWVQKQT